MMFSITNRADLENLTKSRSLESQVEAVRLKDKLGEQKFH